MQNSQNLGAPGGSPGPCACGSGTPYVSCCQPFHKGAKQAETAEQLLRSRYTAFVEGQIDYVVATNHSSTRDQVKRDELVSWSKDSQWLGFQILEAKGGAAQDEKATIVFHARYRTRGEAKDTDHYEQSEFAKEGGQWRFVDAVGLKPGPYVRAEPKLGRNDPCHCGSGKKLKKCHGTAATVS